MTEDGPSESRIERWINIGVTIVAPTTLLGALLFYFGYVSSRAQYAYFGVDVDTIGLSTQDYIMRSPQPLLVPLLVLTLAGSGLLLMDTAIHGRILSINAALSGKVSPAKPGKDPAERMRQAARRSAVFGLAVLGAGVALLFVYVYIRDWPFYGLVTPLALALGAALVAYASRVLNLLQRGQGQRIPVAEPTAAAAQAAFSPTRNLKSVRLAAGALIYVVIAASIFWATATVAQWSGRGLAQSEAQQFDRLPSVILDTKELLFLQDPGIVVTTLPRSKAQTFHYRYRHLRLLIQGHDRMFLVPDAWSPSDSTLIVPLDGSVRVQFQFQNAPP